jgi:hypothetical protein
MVTSVVSSMVVVLSGRVAGTSDSFWRFLFARLIFSRFIPATTCWM